MKRLSSLALFALLAACQSEPATETVADVDASLAENSAAADMPDTHSTTSANGSPVGSYEVTRSDGSVVVATINASGSYQVADKDDTVFETGEWEVKDGKTCFSPSADGTSTVCYSESPRAADGSFTATPDVGDPEQVRPVTM